MVATFGGLCVEQVMYMYITRHTAVFSDLGQQVPKCILGLIVKRLMELVCVVYDISNIQYY